MVRGSTLMLLLQLGERSIGLVSLGLLTRLLTPSDFGLVALATATAGMLTSALATNFASAIISLPVADRADYDTAWTLNAARGALLALLLCAASAALSLSGRGGAVPQVLLALSLLPLLDGLRNVGMTAYRRRLEFFPIVTVQLTSRLVGSIGAVLVAYYTASHWALVTGTALVSVAALAGSYLASPHRPRIEFGRWRKLWDFSGWLAGSNLVSSVSTRADVFFVNHYLGLGLAGIYNMGNEIGSMFHGQVVAPLLESLFPGLARLAETRREHLRAFGKAREVLVGVCLPVGVGVGLVSDAFGRALLGPKWQAAGPVIAIVSLGYTVHLLTIGMDEALQSLRRTRPIFARQTMAAVVRLTLVFAGISLAGLVGLLLARLIAALTMATINSRLLCRELGIRGRDLITPHARPILATASMALALVLWQMSDTRHAIPGPVGVLAADVALGASVFSVILLALWHLWRRPDGFEREAWGLVMSRLTRRGGTNE